MAIETQESGPILHQVFFDLKKGKQIEDEFLRCLALLEDYSKNNSAITQFKVRRYSSSEGLNDGYDYSFKMEFETALARDQYLVDPKHEAIKQKILPLIEKVMAHDSFKTQKMFYFKRQQGLPTDASTSVVHHVFFELAAGKETESNFLKCLEMLKEYSEKNKDITKFYVRRYSSPEGLNQKYDYTFKMEFTTPEARDQYLADPEHEKIKQKILPLKEKVMAYDFFKKHTLFAYQKPRAAAKRKIDESLSNKERLSPNNN